MLHPFDMVRESQIKWILRLCQHHRKRIPSGFHIYGFSMIKAILRDLGTRDEISSGFPSIYAQSYSSPGNEEICALLTSLNNKEFA